LAKIPKSKIMIVDDDARVCQEVKSHLEGLGYDIVTAPDGPAALALAESAEFDLVVLDINFPNVKANSDRSMDGIEILRRLRDLGSFPILMLSATNISAVKVMTLAIGADDYVPKPFDLQELSARVAAILRRFRGESVQDQILSFRRLRLDPGERRVWKDGELVELTEMEFDILYALARRPQYVFTRENLLAHAGKGDRCCVPKAVDVHIGHIRKKIEDDPLRPSLMVTVRGIGYRFEDVPE
jgi:DNA-binding response OmpR family regulator